MAAGDQDYRTGMATETRPEAIDIIAVIKLPLPISAFLGAMRGLESAYAGPLYIRNCEEGYEVFKVREVRPDCGSAAGGSSPTHS